MVAIQNQSTVKEIRLACGVGILETPTQLSNQVIPVLNVNPKDYKIANILRSVEVTTTTANNFYVTPTDEDFYLTSAYLSCMANSTSDNIGVFLNVTIYGETSARNLLVLNKLTTTAIDKSTIIAFKNPLRLARNTNITLGGAFTLGAMTKFASITGYTVSDFENL